MKDKASAATLAEPGASSPRDPAVAVASTHPYIQYPEKAAQSYIWRSHRDTPPPQPPDDTLSHPLQNDIRHKGLLPAVAPVSTRSSKSCNEPRLSNPGTRRTSPAVTSASDRQRNPHQGVGHPAHYPHDPEKAHPTQTAVLSDPHTSHALSTYSAEEEEEEVTEEHTIWVVVSRSHSGTADVTGLLTNSFRFTYPSFPQSSPAVLLSTRFWRLCCSSSSGLSFVIADVASHSINSSKPASAPRSISSLVWSFPRNPSPVVQSRELAAVKFSY